jgi:uncharacterized Zn finger protein (UPF0148 family)
MFCGSCGAQIKEGAKFCPNCGWAVPDVPAQEELVVVEPPEAALPSVCAGCGTPLKEEALFCANCGMQVGGSATGVAARPVTPQYVPQTSYRQAASPAPGKNRGIMLGLSIADLAWIVIWIILFFVSIIKDEYGEGSPITFLMLYIFPLVHAITAHVLLLKEHIRMLKILPIIGYVLFLYSEINFQITIADDTAFFGTRGILAIPALIAPLYALFLAI